MKPNPPLPTHPHLRLIGALADGLVLGAVEAARLAARTATHAKPRRVGQTLRPGPATPLWNTLAGMLRSELKKRGDQTKLARILGVPRQRLHEMLKTHRQLPDAERTLQMLVWLQARHAGRDLA